MDTFTSKENQVYWEDSKTISIIDKNLHKLEMDFVSSQLNSTDAILDLGCGKGLTTSFYARQVRSCIGLERSERFLAEAVDLLSKSGQENLTFIKGDINCLEFEDESFDAIITQRVLINLPSWEEQRKALKTIYDKLKPGGRYIAIENTFESNEAMNIARRQFDLKDIGLHWHNHYLNQDTFLEYMAQNFTLEKHQGFSLYYLLTRVFAQTFASFEGEGAEAKKEPIFDRIDEVSRIFQETYGDRFIDENEIPLGPIQGFSFKKNCQLVPDTIGTED